MRIAVVVPNLATGGAERIAARQAAHWASRAPANDVAIVTIDPSSADFYDVDPLVARVTVGPRSRLSGAVLGRADRVGSLRAALEAFRPDVVVSHVTVCNVLVLAGRVRVPVVVVEHLHPDEHELAAPWRAVRDRLYRRAAGVVVLTEAAGAWARARFDARRVHVIGNAVAVPPAVRPTGGAGERRVVAVGRLEAQKGFDLLLDAFAAATSAHEGWTLEILGEGAERGPLEAQAARLGLGGRVSMPGIVRAPAERMAASEVFVLSSRYEGFPLALVEAMACGLPVVAFDCRSGPAEIVRPGVDGFLVPPADVGALAEAMASLMGDGALRDRFGARAREVTARFGEAAYFERWDALIASAAGG